MREAVVPLVPVDRGVEFTIGLNDMLSRASQLPKRIQAISDWCSAIQSWAKFEGIALQIVRLPPRSWSLTFRIERVADKKTLGLWETAIPFEYFDPVKSFDWMLQR